LVRACKDIGVPVRNKKWKSLATSGPGPTLLLLNSLFLPGFGIVILDNIPCLA